jgi:hypothetical protein
MLTFLAVVVAFGLVPSMFIIAFFDIKAARDRKRLDSCEQRAARFGTLRDENAGRISRTRASI